MLISLSKAGSRVGRDTTNFGNAQPVRPVLIPSQLTLVLIVPTRGDGQAELTCSAETLHVTGCEEFRLPCDVRYSYDDARGSTDATRRDATQRDNSPTDNPAAEAATRAAVRHSLLAYIQRRRSARLPARSPTRDAAAVVRHSRMMRMQRVSDM